MQASAGFSGVRWRALSGGWGEDSPNPHPRGAYLRNKRGEKNLLLFKNEEKFEIFKDNCFEYFNSEKKIDKKFDIIFIDPPYKEIKINMLIEKIIYRKLLKKDGILIIHRHKKDKIVITEKINILDTRTYGVSKVYFAN